MKKSIVLLSLLSLSALAQAETLFSTTFSKGSPVTMYDNKSGILIEDETLTSDSTEVEVRSEASANLLTPDVQMNNNAHGWDVTFNFVGTSAPVTLTDLTLQFQFVTASGGEHDATHEKTGTIDITLRTDAGTLGSVTGQSINRSNGEVILTLSAPTTIEVSTYFYVDIHAVAPNCNGTYLGIQSVNISNTPSPAVPEPATATLSLLALAALAARRRRK